MTRFLHLTDIHFWHICWNPFRLLGKRFLGNANVFYRRRKEFVQAQAEIFGEYVASLGIADVLITGDLTSTALDEEYKLAKAWVDKLRDQGLSITVYPGNHDVYTFESVKFKRFDKYFHEYIAEAGPMPCRIDLPGGTPLVLAPTVCPNYISSKGRITQAEADAVADLIANAPEPLIVSGHYPVLHKTHGYHTKPERQLRDADRLHRALGASGKRLMYVAGHVHRFSYVTDTAYPGVEHLTTGAFFRHDTLLQRAGEFSEIHVGADEFAVYHHVYWDGWKREKAESKPHAAAG